MIFSTKNKQLAIFGKTLDDIRTKFINLSTVFEQYGLSGKNGVIASLFGSNKSQIIPETNLTKVLSFDEANKQLEDFNRRVVQGGMSLDTYFKQYQNGNTVLRNYVTTTDQQSQSTQGLIRASEEARAAQIAHNESIKAGTISAKAASVAFKALSIAGNIIAFTAIIKGIELAATAIDNWIHRVEKANEAMNEAVGEYESAKSSLESVNTELDEQNKKLDELLAKDKLTYAEKGQLEELQAITQELLLQQNIEERRADKASKEAADKAVDAYEKQYGRYDKTEKDLQEKLSYENFPIPEDANDVLGMIAAYIRAQELLEQSQKEFDEAVKNAKDTTWLAEDVQYNIDAVDDYRQALDENISDLQEKRLALEDEYNKAIEKRESGIEPLTSSEKDVIETYESIYDVMKMVYEYTDQNTWNNMEIADIFNTEGIEKTKEELISLAEAGKLTPEYITQNFKTLNKAVQNSEIFLEDGQTAAEAFCEEIYRSSETALQFRDALSSAKSKFGDTVELKTEALNEARENLENEYEKLSDWGLEDYAEKIKNDTISSIFGNVDMDKRTIITWSDELKQTYADALASWEYDPEIGGIDTVFGGSSRFGESINGTGWEVAFTPILPDGTFLSSDTVYEYIESIVSEAYSQNGEVTENALKSIDAQGRQIGDTFVHGIFAAVDDSLDYDNNGNLAETVGRLMHFTGDFGAVKLAKQEIEDARQVVDWDSWFGENINTPDEIELFQKIVQEADNAVDAIEKYKSARTGIANENLVSRSITETIDQLNTQLKPAFDSLQSAWKDIFTTDDNGKSLFSLDDVDLSTFDSIKSELDEMSKLGVSVDYSAFEDFVNVLNNTESTEQNVRDAFDSLATSITQAALSGAEDFDTMRAALEDLGVINNELVAFDALISNTEALKEAGLDLAHASDEQIAAFANEFVAAENVTQAIAMLTFHKELCNLQEMNTAGEVANLRTLAENAGYTGEVIQYLTELEQIYQEVASGTITPMQIGFKVARAAMLKSFIDGAASNINYDPKVDFTKATDSAKKAGSKSGKKAADAYLEAFEKELEKLQGMRDRNEITEKEYLDRLRVA